MSYGGPSADCREGSGAEAVVGEALVVGGVGRWMASVWCGEDVDEGGGATDAHRGGADSGIIGRYLQTPRNLVVCA